MQNMIKKRGFVRNWLVSIKRILFSKYMVKGSAASDYIHVEVSIYPSPITFYKKLFSSQKLHK